MNAEVRPSQDISLNNSPVNTRKEASTPLGKWIDKVTNLQEISITKFATNIGSIQPGITAWRLGKTSPDIESISSLLIYAEASELPEDLKEELRGVIAESIEERFKKGAFFRSSSGRVRTAQKSAPCITRNGAQAANDLGITRQAVLYLREALKIDNLLLTENDIDRIKTELDKNKVKRPTAPRGVGSIKSRRTSAV